MRRLPVWLMGGHALCQWGRISFPARSAENPAKRRTYRPLVNILSSRERASCRQSIHAGAKGANARRKSLAGAAFDVLVDAIARCQRAGEVRAGRPRQLALGAWAIVHGLAILAVDHQLANRGFRSEDPIALAADVTQQLYLGLRR